MMYDLIGPYHDYFNLRHCILWQNSLWATRELNVCFVRLTRHEVCTLSSPTRRVGVINVASLEWQTFMKSTLQLAAYLLHAVFCCWPLLSIDYNRTNWEGRICQYLALQVIMYQNNIMILPNTVMISLFTSCWVLFIIIDRTVYQLRSTALFIMFTVVLMCIIYTHYG